MSEVEYWRSCAAQGDICYRENHAALQWRLDEADAVNARLRAALDEANTEQERLRQGIWDAAGLLGFDRDGDPTPAAFKHPHLADLIVELARESIDDFGEVDTERDRAVAQVERVTALCGDDEMVPTSELRSALAGEGSEQP